MALETFPAPAVRPAHRRNLIFLAVLGSLLVQFLVAWQLRGQIASGYSDFSAFYTAGKIIDTGNGKHLYDLRTQAQIESTFTVRKDQTGFLPYNHAPFEALAFAPLENFSYPTAFWIWWGCNLLLGYFVLFLLRPHLAHLSAHFELAVLAPAFFFPLLVAESQGQDSVLSLLLLTICFVALVRSQPGLAGCALACIAYRPQLALPMLLILAIAAEKRGRIVAGFLLTCVCLAFMSAATVGWRGLLAYPAFLEKFVPASVQLHVRRMPNLRGLIYAAFGPHLPAHALTGMVAVISAILATATIWAWQSKSSPIDDRQLKYALLITVTALTAYHSYVHDMTILLLPLFIVWDWLAKTGLHTWNRKLLALCALLLFWLFGIVANPQLYACILLIFFGSLCWEIRMGRCSLPKVTEQAAEISR